MAVQPGAGASLPAEVSARSQNTHDVPTGSAGSGACCPPVAQLSCCTAEAKRACCGAADEESCGCR